MGFFERWTFDDPADYDGLVQIHELTLAMAHDHLKSSA
jgi:hypothetical protein